MEYGYGSKVFMSRRHGDADKIYERQNHRKTDKYLRTRRAMIGDEIARTRGRLSDYPKWMTESFIDSSIDRALKLEIHFSQSVVQTGRDKLGLPIYNVWVARFLTSISQDMLQVRIADGHIGMSCGICMNCMNHEACTRIL